MKVMHVVAGELTGGAARGAYWLHQAMRSIGIDSVVYTNSRATHGDESVASTNTNKLQMVASLARSQADQSLASFYPKRSSGMFSTGLLGADFTRSAEYRAADVIHLHWINAGFIDMKHLAKIDKPLIWTMRDMWPMTGGCHYSMGCEKFETGCGSCDQLGSRSDLDLSRFVLNRKKKYLPASLKVVGISTWLTEQARRSQLFHDVDVRTISNNVDSAEFFPVDKQIARKMLGIETGKKIVLAGSTNARDPYKGFGKYLESLEFLDPEQYHLCFFGKLEQSIIDRLGFDYTSFGFLHDSISLRLLYSAADVFVAPSLMEAFGKTLAEAMGCGTPVVCFDATGPKDIVTHLEDGFKAQPFEARSLADGVEWVAHSESYDEMARNAREKIVRQFDSRVIARQYQALYEEVLAPYSVKPNSARQLCGSYPQE
ncbi:Glycosyltransferase involved in cell wall bisynthesis [Halopseudomonas xinjiangensis]|uniref:Glycosyltransferase involved in cell wall bisynthesis n=1 Tax=Halopseudomonas xinjiangensis TaxID=487184 RepID=A0A1H1WJB4_9GAMM|nr:glycosyltransferase family 4 protein [Halopseudomonas xinjiangensis]SDS96760.1 Glycosyltransferase involved in cell wall bisynthesis [Halopseudomonas xinjiangensis]